MALISLRIGALAALLGLLGTAGAAVAKADSDGGPIPSASAPQIDPNAAGILDQMLAAYKSLTSYSADIEVSEPGGHSHGSPPELRAAIAFQRPNKVAVRVASSSDHPNTDPGAAISQIVSEGKHYFIESPDDKTSYKKQNVPDNVIETAFNGSGIAGTFLDTVLFRPDSVRPMLLPGGHLKSLAVGAPDTMDGVVTDTLVAILTESGGQIETTATASIGHSDHLLRQLSLVAVSASGEKMPNGALIETYHDIKANVKLSNGAFAFSPTGGRKEAKADNTPPQCDPALKPGASPFAIKTKTVDGNPVSLDLYKGKVVLLDFWATWCPPCREEMPNVVAAYNKYHDQGFEILGVSLDTKRGDLEKYTGEHQMPWPQILDSNNDLAQLYKVYMIPFAILIGRDGKIAAVAPSGELLQPAIAAALAQ